jgi:DNA-binding NtrC family response regulator
MKRQSLSSSEREFLSTVDRIILSNPFGDERTAADKALLGTSLSESYSDRMLLISEVLSLRVEKLVSDGKGDIRAFQGKDRDLVEGAFIFDMYLRFYRSFDDLIVEQIGVGDSPCRVPFARDALSMMIRRGFAPEEAAHFFSICFQLRRAHYFVDDCIVGRSPCMKELRRNLWNNVFTHDLRFYSRRLWNRMEDYSTMLLGGTGTGKSISALAIGRSGYIPFNPDRGCFKESFTRIFVSLNVSQYSEQLIESELFGHKKGSFTGAVSDHEGVLSRCSPHGAIFLDEIGEISTPVQIKLLQVLQDRVFSPVGSHEVCRFPGRVIAATNRPLAELRGGGLFRDDFYYRLCSDIIAVPTLLQRVQEDPRELDDLIDHVLNRLVGEMSADIRKNVTEAVERRLPPGYSWPGNVRELEQCIRRILLKKSYDVPLRHVASPRFEEQFTRDVLEGVVDAESLLAGYCTLLYDRHGTYEEVARRTVLDRRTVKKYIELRKGRE